MTDGSARQPVPFVRRVRVRNYRSIAECDVTLGPLTVLLGFNASGKSNFLDVLKFVADALRTSPAQAADSRGGLDALLHRGADGVAESFEIALDVTLPPAAGGDQAVHASYAFEACRDDTGELPLIVRNETLTAPPHRHHLSGERDSRLRLAATAFRGDELHAVLEARLTAMAFYDLDTDKLTDLYEPHSRTPGLGPAGERLGIVLDRIALNDPSAKERLDAYLSALVPNALGVDARHEGRYMTVEARFDAGDEAVETFQREALSEGTVRAAGVLAALFQPRAVAGGIPLIAIEEPETALHPAGVGALYEALDDAAAHTQVVVTSQSSDLLDNEYVRLEHIRAVANVDGATVIGEVDPAGRVILEKGLMSISELHRSGQLQPATRPAGGGSGR